MDLYSKLRNNQKDAIQKTIDNDFSSGIHYHATGTGKSWIAIYLLYKFNELYPKQNVIWFCERKDILNHQFSNDTLKLRGFKSILSKFNILDFVNLKVKDWYDSLNSSSFWGKPFLCIINRCYLTTLNKYTNIKVPIHLVIHDECHSIENKTTGEFYKWLEIHNKKFNIPSKIIGFSATPEEIKPLDTIISKYSIYDAYLDKVILPPKIVWLKSKEELSTHSVIHIIKKEINKLPYKKIIVWCGVIEECIKLANYWYEYFKEFKICLDFNNMDSKLNKYCSNKDYNFYCYNTFYNSKENCILFCAVKHREGSDIPNLDGCIFMDHVDHRSERVFIQCMGRVLRLDQEKRKSYGLIIDLKAKSTIEICNRVQKYLKLDNDFPWKYSIDSVTLNNTKIFINYLDMTKSTINNTDFCEDFYRTYTKDEIIGYFKKNIPTDEEYKIRLDYEINLIISNNLFGNMVRAIEILELTQNIPHVTRGSCGSSLVCYLLGISHVDPVKYKISFARFINKYRDTLPDIDFDFPHYLRDEVFLKLFQKWGNKVARISNHNYFHEKSALREALRQNGIRKFISKFDLNSEIKKCDSDLQKKIHETKKELEGTFRGYSLHCGGIIYYPEGIPEKDILEGKKDTIFKQVHLNKINVAENKNFKIDILSSRALSQLYYCRNFETIDFYSNIGDQKTIDLLSSGDNIGITLAETPLMRKALLLIKPKSIIDVAICLSIIRPAAKDARKDFEIGKYNGNNIIFDDDIIYVISKMVHCDEEIADKLRRGFCKKDEDTLSILSKSLMYKNKAEQKRIMKILNNLRKYSFCKAHALSYAQLVWQLAYEKAHNPKKFWESTLKNIMTCYRNWVHIYEARCSGILINVKDSNKSIYAKNRDKKIKNYEGNITQLKKYGYWNMTSDKFITGCYLNKENNSYKFKGLIAANRVLNYGKKGKLILFVCVGKKEYIEIIINGNIYYTTQLILVEGFGRMINNLYSTIECNSSNISFE